MNAYTAVKADPVDTFMPWIDEEEKALRQRLHRALTISAARAPTAVSKSARALYWQCNLVAAEWAFKRAPAADLEDIANALVRLFMAAGALERIEGPME